ncbi:MAG: hypothetical protein ACUVS7_18645 [Bryobacteraceae bacterium]
MKHFLWILILAGGLMQAAPAQQGKPQQAKAKAKPAAALTVPAGAEKVEEGVWRAKDAQGKAWIYKKTPFGMIRMEEQKAQAAAPEGAAVLRVVEARGGEAVFERQTPFGRRTWVRRAGEMDEEERRALEEGKKAQQ